MRHLFRANNVPNYGYSVIAAHSTFTFGTGQSIDNFQNGHDIFDAVDKENGMSLWVDMKGNLQFKFDMTQLEQTWATINFENSQIDSINALGFSEPHVDVTGWGQVKYWDPSVQGASLQDPTTGLSSAAGNQTLCPVGAGVPCGK
jgi:hypothetical protein